MQANLIQCGRNNHNKFSSKHFDTVFSKVISLEKLRVLWQIFPSCFSWISSNHSLFPKQLILGVSSIEKKKVVYPGALLVLFSLLWFFVREIFKNMVRQIISVSCKIVVSLQMVEKARQSPESRDIFELQYQTNCSVNVSYNFTNSDLQDGDNKV